MISMHAVTQPRTSVIVSPAWLLWSGLGKVDYILKQTTESDSSEEEDEIDRIIAALSRWRRGKIARQAIREQSQITKCTRSKREKEQEPVLQAPLQQAVSNQGPKYVKVPYYLINLEQCKTTLGKYKENPDKVATLVERAMNSQNPDWADLNFMLDTLLDPIEKRMINKAITTSVEANIANGLLQGINVNQFK
ncbi:hypothetical protein HGM15179_018790 [Zosterops borbonicus]|uniref:Core shell protein Gag P30 domain-containing protein n=1 Tax=Zosterops borbonicus TaxID=364589 RepID=A0A8K1FXZ1_9PASS|nr:hypothetical protein HGM15179_018790 [Zosterops borbonicus]